MNMPRCPVCDHDEWNRVLEETTVLRAYYNEDGMLELDEVDGAVHDSHIECSGCFATDAEFEDELREEIEELFW